MKNYQYKTAIYIGRMQPIHLAHLDTIKEALNMAEKLIIVIGSYNKAQSIKNPFTYNHRVTIAKDAIKEYFGEPLNQPWSDTPSPSILDRIVFVPVRDYMYNDYKWSSEVYSKCVANGATEHKTTILIGCMKDDSSYYLKMFPQWTFKKMPYLHNLDATNIRNEWYCSGNIEVYAQYIMPSTFNHIKRFEASSLIDEYKFIEEHTKMWSVAPYPVSFTTVDSLVIKSGCILVIKRGTKLGFGQYALAGGYLNMNESIRDGALRELKEETKISVPFSVLENSIKEVRVFDHPKRSLRGRIVTHVHLIDLGYGPLPEVKGGDDANEAVWLPIADVMQNEDKFFEDHYDIIVNMTSKY